MICNPHSMICFSPTDTTRQVLQSISQGLGSNTGEQFDITKGAGERLFSASDLVLIGAPVYAGRVAPLALERLKNFKGTNTPAVLVVLYGNRAFEDALLEMKDWAVEAGFVPVAGAAFIGEHSYSTEKSPIAVGRPDREDLDQARAFGEAVRGKLLMLDTLEELVPLEVPGNSPYREVVHSAPVAPAVSDDCTACGVCADSCPSGAITITETTSTTEAAKCIRCCACIRVCPENARQLNAPNVLKARDFLVSKHSDRKIPESFI
ncbi:MAG: 4Fe-4S binding protein [Desulfovibrio sp.]|uniref:4Fe-4S binding protein n=1 Tax=Desulfovibrio sp. 7SRBS1 TaxID=3378064 RepID=UPI003B3D6975